MRARNQTDADRQLAKDQAEGRWLFDPANPWRDGLECRECGEDYGTFQLAEHDRGICAKCHGYGYPGRHKNA